MSLKDRLNIKSEVINEQEIVSKQYCLEKTFCEKAFEELLSLETNILVYCDINLPTYSAINYLCSKIANDKRLVGIGSNLLLNPDEIIKFEPETKNQSKELIKTAISLKPYKIILQDFDGVEAVDIFKLINACVFRPFIINILSKISYNPVPTDKNFTIFSFFFKVTI